jgi:hypothetical protein
VDGWDAVGDVDEGLETRSAPVGVEDKATPALSERAALPMTTIVATAPAIRMMATMMTRTSCDREFAMLFLLQQEYTVM